MTATSSAVRASLLAAALAASFAMTGCATTARDTQPAAAVSPADPWENWNRKVYAFNDGLDQAVVKPVATVYRDAVPELLRTGVSNFFGNIGDIGSAVNHLLQGKIGSGLEMGFRFLTNTVMGFAGVLDPATEFGMLRRNEDFGQTLAVWGVGSGPFVMLPLLGPSTVRDTFGLVADRQVSASNLAASSGDALAITSLEIVELRASLLDATKLFDQIALDRYSFLRDGYLQRRRSDIYDGAPPFIDEFANDPTEPKPPAPLQKPAPASQVPAPLSKK
jgi:phospholipid-binding lipoprotein MlaA